MIHSFSCKNFYSLRDKVEVSFVVDDKKIKDKDELNDGLYFESPSGTLLSKINVVIGANASGKTNVLKMISFIQWFIVESFALQDNRAIPIEQFAFTKADKGTKSEFSVVFELENRRHSSIIYTYNFIVTKERVIEESLYAKPTKNPVLYSEILQRKETISVHDQLNDTLLFKRKWNSRKKEYSLEHNDPAFDDKFQLLKNVKNSSILSNASRFSHRESRIITNFWSNYVVGDVNPIRKTTNLTKDAHERRSSTFYEILETYSQYPKLRQEAESLIEKFDIGFSGIDIRTRETSIGKYIIANAIHHIRGQKYALNMRNESSGTLELVSILGYILDIIKDKDLKGEKKEHRNFAVFDEFEIRLHPDIAKLLLDLFIRTETNTNNTQIIFTTHNHLLLDAVDKYQIIITKKNKQGVTEVYRLDEVDGVEIGDDYFGKYIAGAYGGTPDVTI